MLTLVPPAVGPLVGAMPVTVGAATIGELVGWRSGAGASGRGHGHVDRPPAPAGEVAVMEVALLTVKLVAAVAPNFTALAPVKLVPVMVTTVPPAVGPAGRSDAGHRGRPTKVNWSAGEVALVPPAVVTVTSTVPAPAGEVAVIEVALFTVKLVAAVAPNFTAAGRGEIGAGDAHAGAARGRPAGRSDAGHRGRSHIGELVGWRSGAGAAGRGHGHVHRARSRPARWR